MAQEIDWEKAWEVFWPRYGREAPAMRKAEGWVVATFEEVWKRINPVVGLEETINISFGKDSKLNTTMGGFVLIGAIAVAGARLATETLEKDVNEKLTKLDKRLKKIEKWCGIKKPPSIGEHKPKKKED